MFAHPWVYMIVLPAMGSVSDALPVFCRRPLVGCTAVVLSTVATQMIGFGVWLHHMFATGLPVLGLSFFAATSILITIPSAVQVFAWVATIWTGRPVFTTAFLFFAGFNIGFFPMHITGLLGMPRRIYTYPAGLGWHIPNLITTIGAFILALGILLFFINVAYSLRRGAIAGANRGTPIPWNGRPRRRGPTISR